MGILLIRGLQSFERILIQGMGKILLQGRFDDRVLLNVRGQKSEHPREIVLSSILLLFAPG